MEIWIYLLRASICLVVFYLFYRFVLQQEKTFIFNRYYLLAGLGISLVLPFFNPTIYLPAIFFSGSEATAEPIQLTMAQLAYLQALPTQQVAAASGPNYILLSLYAVLGISILFIIRFLFQLGRLIDVINSNPIAIDGRTRYVLMDGAVLPHSFFNYVFVNKDEFRAGTLQSEILRHEKVHGDQLHSADILIVELIKAIFWFNPILWFYKQSIQLNHEFLADDRVIRDCAIHKYQHTLLSCITSNQEPVLVSHFNYSFTKKRLIMMSKLKTNNWRLASRLAMLMPVLFLSFIISANCQEAKQEPPKTKEVEVDVKEEIKEEVNDKGVVEKKVIKKEVYKVDGKEISKEEAMELMRKEDEKTEKVIKKKMMILDEDSEDLEEKLKELLEGLEEELEGLDIDVEQIKMKLKDEGIFELEREIGDTEKRIQVITKEIDDMDFDFDIDGEETIFKVRKGSAHEDGSGNIFIMDSNGEKIEIQEGEGHKKIIRIGGDDTDDVIWIEDGKEIKKEHILIEGDDEIEKHIKIIRSDNEDGGREIQKKIIVIDGDEVHEIHGEDGAHQRIEIIIHDGDDKKKKKKKRK